MSPIGLFASFLVLSLAVTVLQSYGMLTFAQRRLLLRLAVYLPFGAALWMLYPDTINDLVVLTLGNVVHGMVIVAVLLAVFLLANMVRPNRELVGYMARPAAMPAPIRRLIRHEPAAEIRLERDPSRPAGIPVPVSHAEIFEGRWVIPLYGVIDEQSALQFSNACETLLREGARRILVEVNTPGGRVDAGWLIHERLRLLAETPGIDVSVLVMGQCYSAGVPIILAVPVEKRFGSRMSRFMIHPCSAATDKNVRVSEAFLSAAERAELAWTDESWVIGLIAANTAISRESLRSVIDNRQDAHFSAEEARELGVIGGIL